MTYNQRLHKGIKLLNRKQKKKLLNYIKQIMNTESEKKKEDSNETKVTIHVFFANPRANPKLAFSSSDNQSINKVDVFT